MCVVSMVSDHYNEKWRDIFTPYIQPNTRSTLGDDLITGVGKKEFEELKKDVQEMKKLLERALDYDKRNNEPDCHMDEKVAALKKIAELVGVDLTSIFG